jgi:outer membrane murein-binding lipoprotein Lpp
MRKLILAAVVGTSFALAGCTGGASTPSETAVATDTGTADASAPADASSAAADSSTAAKM